MKLRMPVLVSIAAIAALSIVPAAIHGRYSNRWSEPIEQSIAATSLGDFPREFGDWVALTDAESLSPRVQRELGLTGHVHRIYRNTETQNEVAVLLMVGESGPLVRHPPEICYGNRAHKILSSREVEVEPVDEGSPSEFRVLSFEPNSQLIRPFQVAYGWSSGGDWSVPSWPRVAFGGEAVLYKVQIQLQSELENGSSDILPDMLCEFVEAFRHFANPPESSSGS